MTAPTPTSGLVPDPTPRVPPRKDRAQTPQRAGDRVFSGLSTGAGVLILVVLAGVAAFLLAESLPVLGADAEELPGGESFLSYLGPLVYGTAFAAIVALVIATPLSIAIALYISHYAPRRLSRPIGYVIDLLAAIPSIVYGLWGLAVLAPFLQPSYVWMADNLSFLPFFEGPASATGRTIFTACVVLAVMILPIMTAINREVFLQVPTLHEEAALALGATRWEMIRMSVIPFGKSGIVSSAMLGLGRALGETLAILLVLSASGAVSLNLISSDANPTAIAPNIAAQFPEATGIDVNVLIATGLVLFLITFAVNYAARAVLARRAEFDGAAG